MEKVSYATAKLSVLTNSHRRYTLATCLNRKIGYNLPAHPPQSENQGRL